MHTKHNYLINQRTLTSFNPPEQELVFDEGKNYLFDLSYLAVLEILGDKACEFLQGQLTCDVNKASDIQMVQGAQCNLQGRILTLLDIIDWQGYKLVLPQDLIEATTNSLSKTAMLSRVQLRTTNTWQVYGFYLQNRADLLPTITDFFPSTPQGLSYGLDYCCYAVSGCFYMLITQVDYGKEIEKLFYKQNQLRGSLAWHSLQLARKELSIYPESRGLFLPHRLDLHLTSHLSFNKGCYKGQEIIARMHYKATLKHQLQIYTIPTISSLYSGQKLFSPENQEVGELVDFSFLNNQTHLIAVSILKNAPQQIRLEGQEQLLNLEPFEIKN